MSGPFGTLHYISLIARPTPSRRARPPAVFNCESTVRKPLNNCRAEIVLYISAALPKRTSSRYARYVRARSIYNRSPLDCHRDFANVLLYVRRSTPSARSSRTRLLRTYVHVIRRARIKTNKITRYRRIIIHYCISSSSSTTYRANRIDKGVYAHAHTHVRALHYTYILFNKFSSFQFSVDGLLNIYT